MNIWVSCDLHLWSKDPDVRHPFRSRHEIGELSQDFASGMDPDDLFIFLGDLADPVAADHDKLEAFIGTIPCRKIMCRGNHDQEDDAYYMELGFEFVADIIRYHNILFSHKPIRVAPDEVNVHAHLHTAKMSGSDYNHINAYAANFNKDDRPILLEDLLQAATVQRIDLDEKDAKHIQEKFEKYTSYDNDHYSNIRDITDHVIVPVDEFIEVLTEAAGKSQLLPPNVVLLNKNLSAMPYGVSKHGERIMPNSMGSDDMEMFYKHPTVQEFQKHQGGVCWDFVMYEAWWMKTRLPNIKCRSFYIQFNDDEDDSWPSHTILTFRYGQYVVYLESSNYEQYKGIYLASSEKDIINFVMTNMSDHPEPHIKPGKLVKCPYEVIEYDPLDPKLTGLGMWEFIQRIETVGTKLPHKYSSSFAVPVKYDLVYENATDPDTILDEVLFGFDSDDDGVDHKEWMRDDDSYKKKLRKSQELREKTAVATDESADVADDDTGTSLSEAVEPTPTLDGWIGDHGVWNSRIMIDGKSYREAAEVIIIKGDKILVRKKPDGTYRVPGGSTEPNGTLMDSAIREAQEEVHITPKDLKYYGTYREVYEKGIDYYGKYVHVFVGRYGKPYTGKVAKWDQDEKMLKESKWYPIDEIRGELIPTHRNALDQYLGLLKESAVLEDLASTMPVAELLDEAMIISEEDLRWNMETWEPNGKNFLFIGGLSGGGKSTLANQLGQEHKCEVIHLDDLAQAAFVGRMKNPDFTKRMSPTMQEYWKSTPKHVQMYLWGDERLGLEVDQFINWMIRTHAADGKLYIIEGCEVEYIDADYLIEQPLIIKGTSAMKTTFWRFGRTYGQHREKGESAFKAYVHALKQFIRIHKSGAPIAAENRLARFREILYAAKEYNNAAAKSAENLTEAATGKAPAVTVKTEYRENPNDNVSVKGVKVSFYNHQEELVGEASISSIDTDTGFLYDVEVFPKFRGQGYANSIMEYVLENYKVTELTVEKDNVVAINLYKKYGFRKEMDFEENGKKMIDMQRPGGKDHLDEASNGLYQKSTGDPDLEKYGIRDLTNQHSVEDEEKAIAARKEKERQMKELEKKREQAIKEKKKKLAKQQKQRLKALKRARKARKKKRKQNMHESYLPGVSMQDIELLEPVLDVESESLREHVLVMEDKVQFMDSFNEASVKVEKVEPVYVVVMNTGTTMSKVIGKFIPDDEYRHAAISFDASLSKCFTFSSKERMEGRPIWKQGGFTIDNVHSEFFQNRDCAYAICMVPCTTSQVKAMRKRLDYFIKNDVKFTYSAAGLVANFFHIPFNPQFEFFCSQFVADILNAGKNKFEDPSAIRPDDLFHMPQAVEVMHGDSFRDFDPKKLEAATRRLLNQKKIQKLANEAVLDLSLDNPYEADVLNYQLTMMDEAALEDFMIYLKSFKVRFDKDGNILITRREYDQLDRHFKESLRLIKAAQQAGNIESVKEELYKIYYMSSLIEQYYLKPNSKNAVDKAKDVRKDMLDLRSVMLNAFRQNLTWVTTREPGYNFQKSYKASRYGNDLQIPQKLLVHAGKAIITSLV